MKIKLKLGAVMLFASLYASQVYAFDWFDSLFGTNAAEESASSQPVITVMGPGSGGGHPGVDPN